VADEHRRARDLHLELADLSLPLRAGHLRKVVSELVDNAFKFSPAGTPVRVALHRLGPDVVLEVSGQGRGMTEEQISNIAAFNQFERERFEQQGSGIGLALVQRIASASGGSVTIESGPDAGATVRLAWPA
jgi:signal transduction histidine kinase